MRRHFGGAPTAGKTAARERRFDDLFGWGKPRPVVTYAILAAAWVVTIPSLLYPELYEVFGGLEPRTYPWQLFTAVFEHGLPGFPGLLHLALNTFLMSECGVPCERLLGSRRFVVLSIAAMTANAGTQWLGEGANGSSLIIWAWGPPLYFAMREARRDDPRVTVQAGYQRLQVVLVIMYVAVTIAMPLIPYASGWRGNPLVALLLANQFHAVAAVVGVAAASCWRPTLRDAAVDARRLVD